MKYGIIQGPGIIFLFSKKIFILQKKIIRSMAGVKPRKVFKVYLFLMSMYPLMNFTVSNHETFPTNPGVHGINLYPTNAVRHLI